MAVAEDARQVRPFDQLIEQFLRKRIGPVREIAPIKHYRDAGNFPVPARRILAARQLGGMTIGARDPDIRVCARRKRPRALLARMKQTESREVGQLQRMTLRSPATGDMTERIGAGITEQLGVGRGADAE